MSEIARDLEAETDSGAVMQRIVAAAVREIDGAVRAAMTLLDHGRISSPAHSDDRARRVGEAQQDTGEGPCVDTSRTEVTLYSSDLRDESRWPKWAATALEHGVRSALSVQLFVEENSMGALDLYADRPGAFGEDAENTALLLAAHAAVALAGTRKIENLQVALGTRDVIGQAKGILMERHKINADQAFDALVLASQRTQRKLREIAEYLAESGELPTPPPRPSGDQRPTDTLAEPQAAPDPPV